MWSQPIVPSPSQDCCSRPPESLIPCPFQLLVGTQAREGSRGRKTRRGLRVTGQGRGADPSHTHTHPNPSITTFRWRDCSSLGVTHLPGFRAVLVPSRFAFSFCTGLHSLCSYPGHLRFLPFTNGANLSKLLHLSASILSENGNNNNAYIPQVLGFCF